jgi:hypothetical protein
MRLSFGVGGEPQNWGGPRCAVAWFGTRMTRVRRIFSRITPFILLKIRYLNKIIPNTKPVETGHALAKETLGRKKDPRSGL